MADETLLDPPPPHDVFISYSSLDQATAFLLCDAIEAQGVRVWIAPRDIVPGGPWGEAIIDGINGSRVMVLVFSSRSNESQQVLREVERAVAKRLPILPFRIEDTLPSKSMEYFLSSSHWMNALTPPVEQHAQKLALVVKKLITGESPLGKQARRGGGLVQAPGGAAALARRRSRRRIAAACTALAAVLASAGALLYRQSASLVDDAAVAVLPFRNLANDPSLDYLTLAMPAEFNSQFSRTSSMVVRPLDSVKRFSGKEFSASDVAKTLGVATVVSGSYFRSDQQLRVSVDVIDAKQDRQVWADTFQALVSELLGLLDRMVPKVAEAMRVRLDAKPGSASPGTASTEAYELYLRGLGLGQEINDKNNNDAIELLKKAVALDPAFARAHALLAQAYATRFYWNFSDSKVWLDLADEAARRAIELDPGLPDAHDALGFAFEGRGKRGEAVREYLAGVRSSPNYLPALANLGRFLFYMGEFDLSIATLDKVARIDPTSNVHIRKAMCHYFASRPLEAGRELEAAEKKAQGVDQLTLVAFTHVWLKQFDRAQRILERLEKEQPDAFSIHEIRAWLLTGQGRFAEASKEIEIIARRDSYGVMDEIATLYALQGEREKAIDWLTRAVGAGAPLYAWYRSDFFSSLRGDPRYEAVLRQLEDEYRPLRLEAAKAS